MTYTYYTRRKSDMKECPKYLKAYEEIWKADPKKANLKWFEDAKYGLFLHYGLYSLFHDRSGFSFTIKYP
jgi:alpha-L-fucosidase